MTGTNEKPRDTEEALVFAFEQLNVRQNPELLAEAVLALLDMHGIELVFREVED